MRGLSKTSKIGQKIWTEGGKPEKKKKVVKVSSGGISQKTDQQNTLPEDEVMIVKCKYWISGGQ